MNIEQEAEFFSGGKPAKIMLARSLVLRAGVFIFDEPTVGVDVALALKYIISSKSCAKAVRLCF